MLVPLLLQPFNGSFQNLNAKQNKLKAQVSAKAAQSSYFNALKQFRRDPVLSNTGEEIRVTMAESYDCTECNESLYGQKYILKEDNPFCIKCYEELFSNSCEWCRKLIGCTSKDLSYRDHHWHSECFLCIKCRRSLLDQPFTTKDEMPMCTDCYSNEYSAKCCVCLKTIMPGSKKMEHKGNSWHQSCFICNHCQQPIGTRSFVQRDGNKYCLPCYERQFALQCVHCHKPITTRGVNYRDQPWHKECFVCTGCKQQLAGQRFTSRDDFAYCLACFCNLFAKKCASCTAPISGTGYPQLSFDVTKVRPLMNT
ncbi:Four and a half LIM domains protein 2 [Channa argus]|uniref:Four and a half LIM domains protein 2 n=1 Tax=Channa argus TaxID=215402 RepID=A0A6G1PDQ8_CHAAH|nr:Four and a half LIM domains protein 2 [Channa argus]